MRKESEVQKSRHLLATVVANDRSGDRSSSLNDGCLGEFTETGGNILPPPDDNDDYDEDVSKQEEYAVKSREEWEVRELMRIMREVEEKIKHLEGDDQHQRQLIKREFHESSEKKNTNSDKSQGNYLQRYYHRGAFYLDEDTLREAGPADIRHKAAEYARAATLEDKVDKTKLPQVMQVKKFGFAGNSTKYKGLKSEDTTDKDIRHVPITKKGTGSR
jgi:microfibrillar-associated protein 1